MVMCPLTPTWPPISTPLPTFTVPASPHLCRKHVVGSQLHVVAYVDEVVKFRTVTDPRLVQTRAIHGGVGAEFHAVFQHHPGPAAECGGDRPGPGSQPKTVRPHDHTAIQHHPISHPGILPEHHAGKEPAIGADAHPVAPRTRMRPPGCEVRSWHRVPPPRTGRSRPRGQWSRRDPPPRWGECPGATSGGFGPSSRAMQLNTLSGSDNLEQVESRMGYRLGHHHRGRPGPGQLIRGSGRAQEGYIAGPGAIQAGQTRSIVLRDPRGSIHRIARPVLPA